MLKRLVGILAVGVFALSATAALAAVAPDDLCRAKKETEVGKNVLGLMKAFGKNSKVQNLSKLADDISKAQSKLTKGFTKAEFSGSGSPKGCDTTGDVGVMEDKAEGLVLDALDELGPCPKIPGACGKLSFTTGSPGGICGRINDAADGTGTDLTPFGGGSPTVDCGNLYLGGGSSVQAPAPTPDGSNQLLIISDCSSTSAMTLAPTTSVDTGSNLNCTSPGCKFGAPLPIPNATAPGVSTCVINSIAATPAAGGTLDGTTGAASLTMPLAVTTYLTGDLNGPGAPIQPCPKCIPGVPDTCDFGPNAGGTCVTTTSLGTSHDCPPPGTPLPTFGVDLSPLNNATAVASAPAGAFCTPQTSAGCFGTGGGICKYIEVNGSAPGTCITDGSAFPAVQASVFCIPATGSPLVNAVANLPGPGAVSLQGTGQIVP